MSKCLIKHADINLSTFLNLKVKCASVSIGCCSNFKNNITLLKCYHIHMLIHIGKVYIRTYIIFYIFFQLSFLLRFKSYRAESRMAKLCITFILAANASLYIFTFLEETKVSNADESIRFCIQK